MPNIYEEAKVITHEEARKIVKSNHNKFYTEGTFTNDIQNYIAQCEAKEQRAKKVEELLGLYQQKEKLSKNPYKNIDTKELNPFYEWACEIEELKNKIQSLEEEMK